MKNPLLVLLIVVAFALPSFSQAPSTSTKSTRGEAYLHFTKARMLAEQGQLNEAIAEYKKALEFDPNNSSIYSEMAETYLQGQRIQLAVSTAQSAIKSDPDNIDAHKILASVYTSLIGDSNPSQPATVDTVNSALHEFEEIVRIDPTD